MAARYVVEHDTHYAYSSQVAYAHHMAHLTPANGDGQAVQEHSLAIEPSPLALRSGPDYFGNTRSHFQLAGAHSTLHVAARSIVHVEPRFADLRRERSPAWEQVRDALAFVAGAPFLPASEFCFASPRVPRNAQLLQYAQHSFAPGRPLLAAAMDLMHRIHSEFRYDARSTDVATPMMTAFSSRAGVCQDFSHVMIGCLRSLGLAARYVSGYLYPLPRFAGAPRVDQPVVVGADASHAWVALWCPDNGWVELDPTNNAIPGDGHVRLAAGRDYTDIAPLRGVVQGGGEHELRVAVRLTALVWS